MPTSRAARACACSSVLRSSPQKSLSESVETRLLCTPELLPLQDGRLAQKTEEVVGPYELHDFFLYHFVRGRASLLVALLLLFAV